MTLQGTRRPGRAGLTRATLAATVLLLGACASAPPDTTRKQMRLPVFDSVAVLDGGVTDELAMRFSSNAAEKGAAVGAIAGEATGFAAAFACGPWFLLCAAGYSLVGMAVGASAGAVAGASQDGRLDPTQEQLDQLEAIMERIRQEHEVHSELGQAMAALVPEDRRASEQEAEATVQLRLSDVRFHRVDKDMFQLGLSAQMTVEWNSKGRQRKNSEEYHRSVPAEPIAFWLGEDGANFEQALNDCIAGLARVMSKDLQYTATKS